MSFRNPTVIMIWTQNRKSWQLTSTKAQLVTYNLKIVLKMHMYQILMADKCVYGAQQDRWNRFYLLWKEFET